MVRKHIVAPEANATAAAQAKGAAQRSFIDPESSLVKFSDDFDQFCNDQVAVDTDNRIIIAKRLIADGSDQRQLNYRQ